MLVNLIKTQMTVSTVNKVQYDLICKLLIAKFRLKLKKVGKTTRPFRYDLNQTPYDIQWSDKQIQGIRSDKKSA